MKKLILILTMVVALSCNAMAFAVEEDFLDERHSQVVTLSGESDIPKLETKDEPKEQKEEITDASEKILANMSKKEHNTKKVLHDNPILCANTIRALYPNSVKEE